jgi:hypothetical protein
VHRDRVQAWVAGGDLVAARVLNTASVGRPARLHEEACRRIAWATTSGRTL